MTSFPFCHSCLRTGDIRLMVLARAMILLLTISLFFAVALQNASAEQRQAPNSRVSLDLGPSFQPSDRFSGFIDDNTGASFVIVELPPQAYNEVKRIPNNTDALAKQGLSDAVTEDLPGWTGDHVYFTAKQKIAGTVIAKFVLIFRQPDIAVMISTNVPEAAIDAGTYTKEQIEVILASARVEDKTAKAAELFRFNYLGPFRESLGLMGTTKAYNTSGRTPAQGENLLLLEPTILVSPSIDNRVVDAKLGAQRSFQGLGGLKDKTIETQTDVVIAGLNGYRIAGEMADEATGTKIAVNLILLVGEQGGYFVMVGTAPLVDKEKFMPEIEKVMTSFEAIGSAR